MSFSKKNPLTNEELVRLDKLKQIAKNVSFNHVATNSQPEAISELNNALIKLAKNHDIKENEFQQRVNEVVVYISTKFYGYNG